MNLSKQEEQVLLLAMTGLGDKEVADQMHLSTETVRTYWKRIRNKLGGRSRSEIIADRARLLVLSEVGHKLSDLDRLQQELQTKGASESRYRTVFEDNIDAIFVWDLDGTILDVNTAGAELFGYEPIELRGRNGFDFLIADADMNGAMAALDQMRQTGTFSGCVTATRQDGTKVVLDWRAKWLPTEEIVLAVARDVTEEVEADRDLLKFRDIFETVPTSLALIREEGPTLERVNRSFSGLYRYDTGELEGRPVSTLYPDSNRGVLLNLKDHDGSPCEETHLRKNGEELIVCLSLAPLHEDGSHTGFWVVCASPK